MKKRISLAAAVAAVLAATACGSGGGTDTAASAPATGSVTPVTTEAPVTEAPASTKAPATASPSAVPSTSAPASRTPSSSPSKSPTKTPTRTAKPSTSKPATTPRPASNLDQRCLTGRAICVDKSTRKLSWVVDGKVRYSMAVRFGSAETPTREGSFKVYWKSRDHVSTIYHTPMPYALFFDGGQAVHYSADFAANGYNGASHGCVNVRDKGAVSRLFDEAVVGDKVIVYRS
jgi:hypothetical protein